MNGTVLKDIGSYKQEILYPLLDSKDIQDLLLVGVDFSHDLWYGNDEDDTDTGIMYKQMFPYLYMDETQTEVKAYICYEVDVPRFSSATIKDMKIIVWCICHKSAMNLTEGKSGYLGTRADMLADAVERALRGFELSAEGNNRLGIGRLELTSVTYLTSVNKEFYGRQLLFTVPDFAMKGRV